MFNSQNSPSVALLILNWNGRTLLERSLPPLVAQQYPDFHILLVDNASTDDSVSYTRNTFPSIEIIENSENLGFARGINVGLKHLQSQPYEYVILLNTDVFVAPGWLSAFIATIDGIPNLGIAGCKLLFPDGNIQHLGGELEWPLAYSKHFHFKEPNFKHSKQTLDVDYVTGAAFAISQEALAKVPLFDEQFHPFYLEEVDYCYQVRDAGLRVIVACAVEAIHAESASTSKLTGLQSRSGSVNRLRFVVKHYSLDQLINEFVPAETENLERMTASDLYYWREAVSVILFELSKQLQASPDAIELKVKQAAFLQLRKHHLLTLNVYDRDTAVADGSKQYHLTKISKVEEFSFVSSRPIVAKIRAAWHGVAGRWALRYVVQQQNQFNAHIMQMFGENLKVPEVSGREVSLLLEELLALREQVSKLDQQVQTLMRDSA